MLDEDGEKVEASRLHLRGDVTQASAFAVITYEIHPRLNLELNLFDVAVLKVDAEMDESDAVMLPSRNEAIFHGTSATITAWDTDVS